LFFQSSKRSVIGYLENKESDSYQNYEKVHVTWNLSAKAIFFFSVLVQYIHYLQYNTVTYPTYNTNAYSTYKYTQYNTGTT